MMSLRTLLAFVSMAKDTFVNEFNSSRVQVLSEDGETVFKFGESGPEKLNHPLACTKHKNIFIVSDSDNNCLKVFDS